MKNGEFIFEKTVYLTDTNSFGNVYFARYFDWQGMAREDFFRHLVQDYQKLIQAGIKFVTIEATIKFHSETVLFDEVVIKVKPENIKTVTFDLIFTYINKKTNQLIAIGKQKIGFVDSEGAIIKIPMELVNGWEKFIGEG
jgi:YbgC/YbaW family acyl-CoA thioester hydrolase